MGKELTMKKKFLSICLAACLVLVSGCGGGGGSTVPLPTNKAIVLSANLKTGLTQTSQPIRAIEVTVTLPLTASVSHSSGSLTLGETGLKNLNLNGSIQAGSFDVATGTVHFILLPNDILTSDLGAGTGPIVIARLTYETTTGVELLAQDILKTLTFKVSGPDTFNLTSEIVPSVAVSTYLKP